MVLHFNKLESPSSKDASAKFGQVVLEKKIFNFLDVFSLFRNYLPLKKAGPLHLNKL